MLVRFLSRPWLERSLVLATLALGLFHAWLGRYSMDPDGMSYLDVGQSFFRRDWANAISAYWGPLYPWTVGLVLGVAKPSAKWEFPVARLVSFGVFVLALLAFRFLSHALVALSREQTPQPSDGVFLPEWMMVLIGYPTFLWLALEVETPWYVGPDLAVMACVCLTAGMLLRLRRDGKLRSFALFGLILGVGYWTKSILFPFGFVTLAAGYWWKRSSPGWGRRMLIAALVFLCASAPLILLLSHQKGRFTFGDTGMLAYAWFVSPRTFWRNWQGKETGSGIPVHPTRQLLQHPPLFEFDGPVAGTYPPWTDPSYWNEGLKWHFKLKPQLEVLAVTIPSEIRLLLRGRPDLVAGVIVLALLCGRIWLAGLCELWPLIAISAVGMGLYLPLLENDRYFGGFVLVLFFTLLAAGRLRRDAQQTAAYVTLALFFTMSIATADYTLRIATHHLAIPGNGPNSTVQDISAAEKLWRMGLQPGDKVAIIMNGTPAYWAHLAKLRIVAEIMDTGHGTTEFWNSPREVQQHVFDLFAGAHAKLVVTRCPSTPQIPTGWEQMEGTPYCVHPLD
ncbi:MAG: hypothetical protein WCA20_21485 [Candidatus Sulfotelmatobacter sp.]